MKKVMEWMKQHKTALQLCGICVAVCAIVVVAGMQQKTNNHTHDNDELTSEDANLNNNAINDDNATGDIVKKVYKEQTVEVDIIDINEERQMLSDDELQVVVDKYQGASATLDNMYETQSNYVFDEDDCVDTYINDNTRYEKMITEHIENIYNSYEEIDFEQIPYGTPVYYLKENADGQHEICMTRSNPDLDEARIQKMKNDFNEKESITIEKEVTARIDGVFGHISNFTCVYSDGFITDENGKSIDVGVDVANVDSNWDFIFKWLATEGVDFTPTTGSPIPSNNYSEYEFGSDCSGQEELIKSLNLLSGDISFTKRLTLLRECDGSTDVYTMNDNDSRIDAFYLSISANTETDNEQFVNVIYSVY